MKPWEHKAHKIIAALAFAAWEAANPRGRNGKRPKRSRPYRVPELADQLVRCLATRDEETAKALFLSYDGLQAIR